MDANERRLLVKLAEREQRIPRGLEEAAKRLENAGLIKLTYHLSPMQIYALTEKGFEVVKKSIV